MGDITELGDVVAGAFAHPDQAGRGEYLPLVGDFMSFNEIIDTLNRQGRNFSFHQVPKEVFAGFFPGAGEIAEMFTYFQVHTYLGSGRRLGFRRGPEYISWLQRSPSQHRADCDSQLGEEIKCRRHV
jgi:hypothetical protein